MNRTLGELRTRFEGALRGSGALRPGGAVFEELVARYGEPHRHYHTLDHVAACLGWLERFVDLAERPHEVALALWFHDAIYDPRARDNEARSAALARTRLEALGLSLEARERIATHVLSTRDHDATSGDAALVVDLDLTILGASPSAFHAFEEAIRREYAHVPGPLFRFGRRRLLKGFLERSPLYRVPELAAELEAPAWANLARRIDELAGVKRFR